ncbi:MAG TPA: N-acetylmuramoyl-L-alanine amidase [Methylovirgula sp.]|nr:N-acetylmuramoyl-L-alanine amidase [Methylovirgula sp.]
MTAFLLCLSGFATRADGPLGPHGGPGANPPVAAGSVDLENGPEKARLTFALTRPVKAGSFVLTAPDRLVVDLPQIDFRINPQIGCERKHRRPGQAGLISSFRFGLFAPGKSRIVIDLAGPARVVRAESEPAGTAAHLVIELAKTDRAAFQAAAQRSTLEAEMNAPEQPSPAKPTAPGLPLIVIDPGHGGIDSGAIVKGLVEKNIVFEFAKALAAKLTASGRYKIVMTRDSDVFLPLGERVRIAQDSGAALFVSVHADTISDAAQVSGATVYTLSDHATDAEAARIAEDENRADATAGVVGNDEPGDVSDILADLTRQETRAYSHVFARTLVNYWRVAARLNKNPERAAGFRVLKAPDVPSVLIELGYLSNPQDAANLVSAAWRESTASRVASAINAYFDVKRGNFGAAEPGQSDAASVPERAAENK